MNAVFNINKTVIETERLMLRPFRQSDLQDFYEYASVAGVGEMAGWHHHETIEKTQEILADFIAEDKTFAIAIGKRTIKGTYELNGETKEVTLNFGSGILDLKIAKLTMTLTKTGDNIDLVSNADKLLKLIQTTISTSKNSTLSTIGSLVANYDGMMIGFSFTKK